MSSSYSPEPRRGKFHLADQWANAGTEPSLDELFADPLLHLVIRRDRLSSQEVRRAMQQARHKLTRDCLCCQAA